MSSYLIPLLILILSILLKINCSIGPDLTSNFPDPAVIRVDDKYYGFATRTPKVHVQVAEASNFTAWKLHEGYDAMPTVPKWVSATLPEIWAPDVKSLPDGSFVLYFAAVSRRQILPHGHRQHCIGAALSKTVLGPYKPLDKFLACDLASGGAIDPEGFHDPVSDKHYLLYKVDGNSLGRRLSCHKYVAPTPLVLQQVSTDGVTLIGEPVSLLLNSRYDGPSIEAPSLLYHEGKYYLLHNSRCYAREEYTVRYAVSYTGITGPYRKAPRPLLITGQTFNGVKLLAPGGVDVDPSNSSRFVFHADTTRDWFALKTFDPAGRVRAMFAAELYFEKGGLLTARSIA